MPYSQWQLKSEAGGVICQSRVLYFQLLSDQDITSELFGGKGVTYFVGTLSEDITQGTPRKKYLNHRKLKIVYTVIGTVANNLAPEFISDMYEVANNVHNYNTRYPSDDNFLLKWIKYN